MANKIGTACFSFVFSSPKFLRIPVQGNKSLVAVICVLIDIFLFILSFP